VSAAGLAVSASLGFSWTVFAERGFPFLVLAVAIAVFLARRRPRRP
jgi:hypothetical protein